MSESNSSHSLPEQAIVDAIRNGDIAVVSKAIEAFSSIEDFLTHKISIAEPTNHAIGYNATFLQLASFRNWKGDNVAGFLIERGAQVDIHSACGLGMADRIVEILKANPTAIHDQVDTYYPLQYAIAAAQPTSIECLMKHGDAPNRDLKKVAYFGWENETLDTDYQPWKPIHMASLWGFDATRIPVAECLNKHGADLNALSPLDGFRAIHLVAMSNRVAMIKFFVNNGVDVDSRTKACNVLKSSSENAGPIQGFDCTALMVACAEGFVEATQCLVELGADVNARNSLGKTPMQFATQKCWNGQPYDMIIELLISRGADKHATDDDGAKPLNS